MNRRGFFGLLGKLVAVGVAMNVAPELLEPVKAVVRKECLYYDFTNNAIYRWDGVAWAKEVPKFFLAA